jgi:hypothetical protein
MKATVEWKDHDVWKHANVELRCSKNGNQFFTHHDVLYVFAGFKEGTQVVSKTRGGPWTPAGRICRNVVFLGDGLTWSETNEQNLKGETKWTKPVMP